MKVLSAISLALVGLCSAACGFATTATSSFGVTIVVPSSCQASVMGLLPNSSSDPAGAARFGVRVVCTNSSSDDVRATMEMENQPMLVPRTMLGANPTQLAGVTVGSGVIAGDFRKEGTTGAHVPPQSGPLLSSRNWAWESTSTTDGAGIERITITY